MFGGRMMLWTVRCRLANVTSRVTHKEAIVIAAGKAGRTGRSRYSRKVPERKFARLKSPGSRRRSRGCLRLFNPHGV